MINNNVCSILKNEYKGMTPGEAFDWLLLNPGKHVYGVYTGDCNIVSVYILGGYNCFLRSEISDSGFNWDIIENDMFSNNIFYTPDQFEKALEQNNNDSINLYNLSFQF